MIAVQNAFFILLLISILIIKFFIIRLGSALYNIRDQKGERKKGLYNPNYIRELKTGRPRIVSIVESRSNGKVT